MTYLPDRRGETALRQTDRMSRVWSQAVLALVALLAALLLVVMSSGASTATIGVNAADLQEQARTDSEAGQRLEFPAISGDGA
jgi:hypothetical protein